MVITSWKTSLVGLALIVIAIAGMSFAGLDKITAGAIISAGIGFLLTKDGNVTGGSVAQATPPGVAAQSINQGILDVLKGK